jgi:NAD(P)-dependent dehydrogenase (short-subunit alcohol dehydrogenase family)
VNQVIVITGASSGFGALTARALADAGHMVYAGIRNTTSRNADAVTKLSEYAASRHVELNSVEMDVSSTESVDAGIASIVEKHGRLDVVVHNAGHMVTGPTEAFTPEEVGDIYDTNVLGTQRVNRAALPHLRAQGSGLLVWVSSTSVKGGTPPYLGPYFAAKAAMDSLAVSYAAELARFGIDTTIIVPGSFTHGTNHFAHAGLAADTDVVAAYDVHYQGLLTDVAKRLADLAPTDADAGDVAAAIVSAVDSPAGKRPYRVHIDPADDGSAVVSAVADRIRVEFLNRIGLADLLAPSSPAVV